MGTMHPFFKQTLRLMDIELERIQMSFARLSEDDIWKKPRNMMNRIGNLCLHLAGNEHQNIVSGIGKKRLLVRDHQNFLQMAVFQQMS